MSAGLSAIFGFYAFCLGACVASFLNVVAWRVPRGESVVSPPSHCPKCGAAIRWWQNIPVVSWLALRGRCAACRAPISPRYVIVETIGGCLFLAAAARLGVAAAPSAQSILALAVWWIWISLMIVGSSIDFEYKLLPDFATVGGMALGVAHAAASAALSRSLAPLGISAAGLAIGFGGLWLVRYFGSKAFKREAMGMGDVLLMGAVGALFGPVAVVATLILSSLAGSAVGLAMVALSKTRFGAFAEIPFGPYICAGCLAWMFAGPELVEWYIALLSP